MPKKLVCNKNADLKVPADFNKFLSNGDNKERMFGLMEDVWAESGAEICERIIYLARGGHFHRISRGTKCIAAELATNHEGTDTKIAYLAKHAEQDLGQDSVCLVRSSSGDTDLPVVLLVMPLNLNIIIDNGTWRNRKHLDLSKSGLTVMQGKALLGMHAFSGNDFISSMLRKGKQFLPYFSKYFWFFELIKCSIFEVFGLHSTHHDSFFSLNLFITQSQAFCAKAILRVSVKAETRNRVRNDRD